MPGDLNAYLASRYLVADPKPTKKKKKKSKADPSDGLLITDDADSAWGTPSGNDAMDEDAPLTVADARATSEFRKAKQNNWKSVGVAAGRPNTNDEAAAAADAILASAARETAAAGGAGEDDTPMTDTTTAAAENPARMSDGTHAGLQSAAAVSAQLARRAAEERADFERSRKSAKEVETVYRDATGRRIDVSMKKAEARKAAAEAEEKERLAKENLKGEVQKREQEERRERLVDARGMKLARGADDEEMNRELRQKERWNDPMAQFQTESTTQSKKGKSKRRPVYNGAAPPNRYGIKPGYRWDGVDRGNGFEAERFKAINRRERNRDLDYSWQMDE